MTLTQCVPAWGRVRGSYSARIVARSPGGLRIPLGEHRTDSPRLALRWLRGRARDVADQLDPSYAHPVRAWLVDADEHTWALDFVAAGDPYMFRVTDEHGTRYVLIAEPVAPAPPPSSLGLVRAESPCAAE